MPRVIDSNGRVKSIITPVTTAVIDGYIYGFHLEYLTATTLSIDAGSASNSVKSAILTTSTTATLNTATLGSINGVDRIALAGTVATNTANATVTGTSTAFLTGFGTRTCSGTITGAGTTITGTSTKFLTEFSVNDLIGTAAVGYSRITAIATDVSLTIVSAMPGGSAGGTTPICIENATFQANAQTVRQINTITNNTSMTLSANSSATESGVTGYAGAVPTNQTYMMIWVGTGVGGTNTWLSTQRTTPFGISGYSTTYRRVGSLMWTGSALFQFDQTGKSSDRTYQYEFAVQGNSTEVVLGTSNGVWTAVVCSGVVPALAVSISFQLVTTAITTTSLRKRNTGSSTASRNLGIESPATECATLISSACDAARCIDFTTSNATTIVLRVYGYIENL